jgi:two-component system CheB/CheR fusion protein
MLGLPRAQLARCWLHEFVDSDRRQELSEFVGRVFTFDEGTSETCELSFCGPKGERIQVRLVASLLAGTRTSLVAVLDITPLKRAEAALVEESRLKDQFLAALSHELRNPLAPIRNAVSLLQHEAFSHRGQKALGIIDRQVDHLVRIVDDLLDVTRIACGKLVLERKPLDVRQLVGHTVDDYRPSFERKRLGVDVSVPAEPLWVDGDQTRLVEVLGNLLVNAEKFTPAGGRVEVTLRRDGRESVLSVRDSGVGIDPDMLGRLFEPFSQGPQGLARSGGGLGLGLAMVKGLIELHGGTVEATSRGAGQGSCFVVRLPLGPEPTASMERPTVRTEAKKRILVIEDSVDTSNSLRDLLTLEGHDVQVAHDGPAGLDLARSFHPEVVLCDIGLPGMDGYEVARAMRNERDLKASYIVALSGYALPEDRRRAAEAGFDRHVAKPPSASELHRVIAEAR